MRPGAGCCEHETKRAAVPELDRYFADTALQRTVHCQGRPPRLTGAGGQRRVTDRTFARQIDESRESGGEPGWHDAVKDPAALVQGEQGTWQESI